jgi:hypothetical protein
MPARSVDDPRVSEAIETYRKACARVLCYRTPRPRNLRDIIRAAAEVLRVADPNYFGFNSSSPEGSEQLSELDGVLGALDRAVFFSNIWIEHNDVYECL